MKEEVKVEEDSLALAAQDMYQKVSSGRFAWKANLDAPVSVTFKRHRPRYLHPAFVGFSYHRDLSKSQDPLNLYLVPTKATYVYDASVAKKLEKYLFIDLKNGWQWRYAGGMYNDIKGYEQFHPFGKTMELQRVVKQETVKILTPTCLHKHGGALYRIQPKNSLHSYLTDGSIPYEKGDTLLSVEHNPIERGYLPPGAREYITVVDDVYRAQRYYNVLPIHIKTYHI